MNFSCAFQPIVNVKTKTVYSYEALVRGTENESAASVFAKVADDELIEFDLEARKCAIRMAAKLQIGCNINIDLNFLPRSLQMSESYISKTLIFAEANNLRRDQIIIEITEEELIKNHGEFADFINCYRATGVKAAIDDFGSGYAGLNMLANFLPDIIKLDRQLISNIENHGPKQAIVKAVVQICADLGIDIIAEGIENVREFHWLKAHGIFLYQGYLFAKPGFECLPQVYFPT